MEEQQAAPVVEVPIEVSERKPNGADGAPHPEIQAATEVVAESKVAEAVSMQDQIRTLEAQLKQERIDRLLERRTGLIGWATANQLEQMETQRALLELGWKPPKQG